MRKLLVVMIVVGLFFLLAVEGAPFKPQLLDFIRNNTDNVKEILSFKDVIIADYNDESTVKSLDQLKQVLRDGLYDRALNLSVKYQGDSENLKDEINTILEEILEEDHYLKYSVKFRQYSYKGLGNRVNIDFDFEYYTSKEEEDVVEQSVGQILSHIVTKDMNQHQKLKAIHDYILLNVEYDESLEKNSAYHALVDKTTVCSGYALLTQKMLTKVGIESKIVTGVTTENHAWNLVKLDGKWYHVDTTWNDPVPDKKGRVIYNYYNLSTEQISLTHKFEVDDYPVADNLYYQHLIDNINSNKDRHKSVYQTLLMELELNYMMPQYTANNISELENKVAQSLSSGQQSLSIRYTKGVSDIEAYNMQNIFRLNRSLHKINYSYGEYPQSSNKNDIIIKFTFVYR